MCRNDGRMEFVMKLFQKKDGVPDNRTAFSKVSGILSPVCKALFYCAIVLMLVLFIIFLILLCIKNTAPEDMILPPFMHHAAEDGVYKISLCNGILVTADAQTVTLSAIKAALYCGIALAEGILLVLTPILLLLSVLLKNIAEKKLFLLSNARYIGRIGWCILIGNSAVLLIRRFFNYYLIKVFLPPEAAELISFRAGPDLMGLVMGILVLLLSAVYGYACRMHAGGFETVDAQPPANL